MSRLRIRQRLLVVVLVTVAAALALLIAGFNLLLAHNLSGDADQLARARASGELGVLTLRNGRLAVMESPDDVAPDTFVWVFSGSRMIESPTASAIITDAARRLAARGSRFLTVPQTDTRLYVVPVVESGRRYGAVVAGVSLKPYDQTRRAALFASLGLGAAVLVLVALAARWLLASALRPVSRMTRLASEWSERDLDRRFDAGEPRDELTELAATLDAMLDRLAASLRREQRFSAELSHELRTPLARVIAESELALRRPRTTEDYRVALELVHENAKQVTRTIDALVAAARHEAGQPRGTADAFDVASTAAVACNGLAAKHGVAVEVVAPPRPIRLGVEAELAERVLQPVVENACLYGRTRVRISLDRGTNGVVYRITDDGRGVAESERERIFEPGARGDLGLTEGDGAGLGLALARRLARSVSGEVESEIGSGGRFVVRLPAA